MQSRARSQLFRYLLSLLVVLLITTYTQGQDTPPTPDTSLVLQGGSNLGLVQPFTLERIMTDTGIQAQHDSNNWGQGQRIGILDLAFGNLTTLLSQRVINTALFPGYSVENYSDNSITHGTDVLEIIATIAPEADFYLCRYNSYDEFISCIDWMVVSGVNIINHSVGVPTLPLNGNSIWAREVERAIRSNILWVNAAGNFAGGYVRDYFTDTDADTLHEFRAIGIAEEIIIGEIEQPLGRIMLSWQGNTEFAANQIDLNLEVLDIANNVIAASTNVQNGGFNDMPLEMVAIDMRQTFKIRISMTAPVDEASGQDNTNHQVIPIGLFVEFADIQIGEEIGSIITPADSMNAVTVGALQGNRIAPYSSRGPVEAGGIKPDITAPGEVYLSDGRAFVGTSAAAPIVSGAAALVWAANRQWTWLEVVTFLEESALDDSEIYGPDSIYGMGQLHIPSVAVVTPSQPPPSITTIAPRTITPVSTSTPDTGCERINVVQAANGRFGRVSEQNAPHYFHENLHEADDVTAIGQIPATAIVKVVGSPECVDNQLWLEVTFGNQTGWLVSADNTGRYIEIVDNDETLPEQCDHTLFMYNGVGCPDAPAETMSAAYQSFERGFMVWREEPSEIWILANDGSIFYQAEAMTFILPDNSMTHLAPPNLTAPISGFGRVWGNSESIRDHLGWGLGSEEGYDARFQMSRTLIDGINTVLLYFTLPNGSVVEVPINDTGRWRYL